MNKLSKKIGKTSVKILSTFLSLSLGFSNTVYAADPDSSLLNYLNKSGSDDICAKNYGDSVEAYASCRKEVSKALSTSDKCDNAKQTIRQAEADAAKACGSAGLGSAGTCVEKAIACGDELDEGSGSSDGYGATQAIAALMGTALPSGSSGSSGSCPQYSGADYADRKEILDDKIKQLNEELADLSKDIATTKDQYQKDVQQIQKDMNEAQEDLTKQKKALKAQQREELAAAQKEQSQMQQSLKQANLEKISLQGQLTSAQIDEAKKLQQYSPNSANIECTKKLSDYQAAMKTKSKGSTTSLISSSKKTRAEQLKVINDCLADYKSTRAAILSAASTQQKLLSSQIDAKTSEIANLQTQLQTASDNFNSTVSDQNTAMNEAEQSLVKKLNLASQEMQSLQTKLNDDLAAIAQKQANLRDAINRASMSLSELTATGKPKSGTKVSAAEASATIDDSVNIIDRYMDDPDLSECNLSSKYSTKRPTTSKSKAKPSTKKSGATGVN